MVGNIKRIYKEYKGGFIFTYIYIITFTLIVNIVVDMLLN